jgi:hypothetical protein
MNYFEDQLRNVQESPSFLGADGWEGADAWDNADGNDSMYADAVDMSQSQPYIFTIVNTTTDAVSSVEVLNAAVRQGLSGYAGLTYTNGYANLTYQNVLAAIASGKGFEAGLVKLLYSHATEATAIANTSEVITVTTNAMNGNQVVKTFVPILDDYQQIKTQVTLRYSFLVDGLVSLKINSLSGSCTVKVMIFPKAVVNQFKQIKGQNPVTALGRPKSVNPALGGK